MRASRRARKTNKSSEPFIPEDSTKVKHVRIGGWDFYEQLPPVKTAWKIRIPWTDKYDTLREGIQKLPFVWRMVQDVASVKGAVWLILAYIGTAVISSLLPAVALWYSGQILKIVEIAVEKRTVDTHQVFRVVAGRLVCNVVSTIVDYYHGRARTLLNVKITRFFSVHIFYSMSRLDVPTYDEPTVKSQIDSVVLQGPAGVAMNCFATGIGLMRTFLQAGSQLLVLLSVLQGQRDGALLAFVSILESVHSIIQQYSTGLSFHTWAATTRDSSFIRLEGLKQTVSLEQYKKEIVAGNMWEHMVSEYQKILNQAGDVLNFQQARAAYSSAVRLTFGSFLRQPLRELPQAVFAFRAVQYPASIPMSLASLNLITSTTSSFGRLAATLLYQTDTVGHQLQSVADLYNISKIPNIIPDGPRPFPENTQTLTGGVSIEFRNVSFKYPGSDSYALKNVCFKILPGQLCVILGTNGSGKSTILKLIARIYDPVEGQIFMDDQDIKTLRLSDLRNTISVLFQDFSHFPLSIKENIGLGNPSNAHDEDMIHQAAQLGGAENFIEKLPEGFDTYLERPEGVRDRYGNLPQNTTSLFGRSLEAGSNSTSLSGGQLQRLALSRTFMRTLSAETGVGLLLFDEPSASLDPAAEHDLFERLRKLRGQRTMIFSSHRFGNLTRHADLILYMNDSEVLEHGTHDELIQRKSEYGRIWSLQAQAFL